MGVITLTSMGKNRDTVCAAAKSAAEFGSSNTYRRTHRQQRGFFVSKIWQALLWAGHTGRLRSRRLPVGRSSNSYGSAHPFGRGWRLTTDNYRTTAMTHLERLARAYDFPVPDRLILDTLNNRSGFDKPTDEVVGNMGDYLFATLILVLASEGYDPEEGSLTGLACRQLGRLIEHFPCNHDETGKWGVL